MLCLCVCVLCGLDDFAAAAVVLSLGCCCRLEANRGGLCGFSGGIGGSVALWCIRNIIEEDICIVCELGRIGAFLEHANLGQLLGVLLECVIAALNRRLVVVGLENLCAEVRVAGDILLFGDDLCGLVRVFLYPLRCLLYGTGEGCCSLRVLLSQLAGDECCAAVLVLVLGIGCGVDESGQTVLLLCNRSRRSPSAIASTAPFCSACARSLRE